MANYSAERKLKTAMARWGRSTLKTRLFSKIFVNFESGCWEWTAATARGYGIFHFDGCRQAHATAWQVFGGAPLPAGMAFDHLCRNTRCVNPEHLEQVTPSENSRRMHAVITAHNALKTTCPQGHPYDETNTRHSPSRRARHCIECGRTRAREYARRKRARALS